MAFWVELHCDLQKDGADLEGRPRCYSAQNNNPGMMVRDATNIWTAPRELAKEARAIGWRKSRSGWQCPSCRTV